MRPYHSAFPVYDSKTVNAKYELIDGGMTLRDYFAGQVLAGCFSANIIVSEVKVETPEAYAIFAYSIADAMLVEREKPE